MAAGRKKIRSVVSDPRWHDLVIKYRYDWALAAVQLFNKEPTWQQDLIIESVQETASWTTVSSGHGTGKSDITSIMILCYLLFYPNSRVVMIANNIRQVKTGVFKYIRMNWKECIKVHPWLQNYFVLTDSTFYEITGKGVWTVIAKACKPGNEEGIAGEHAEHLLYIIDEASGVSDKALQVITGALSQDDNRILLLSQPTRPSGFFYDSHHRLAKRPGNKDGLFNAITLNSEEAPSHVVTLKFIKQKLAEYGGRDSTEYMIKVRGLFPSTVSGFLLGRDECDRAARRKVRLKKGWGWLACCDVGNGRDKSIISIFKVSGHREKRRVVPHKVMEMPSTVTPSRFADVIFSMCNPEIYSNISIVIDGDGIGSTTADVLSEKHGIQAQRIRWGKKMHSNKDKKRFFNQRAFAHIMARDAIQSGRMRLDNDSKTLEQASKIPASLNEAGQWVMMPKPVMRQKLNIKSPDRFDTYCFSMIGNYIPANEELNIDMDDSRSEALDWLKKNVAA